MDVDKVSSYLDRGPCVVAWGNPFNLLLLDDFEIADDIDIDHGLDDISRRLSRRRIVIRSDAGRVGRRFPRLFLAGDPPDREFLNDAVCRRYPLLNSLLPKQSEVPERVTQVPDYETAVLIVVDGLSYEDSRMIFPEAEPMIADGPTMTKDGIRRIIGTPTIAQKMFNRGFKLLGYSYWTRDDNPLTDEFFSPIPRQDHAQYREFADISKDLGRRNLFNTYIQIYMEGLDGVCHRFRDSPPIDAILRGISEKISIVREVIAASGTRATIFLTSDHGILWNTDKLVVTDDPQFRKERSPRYTSGRIVRPYATSFSTSDSTITSLHYPYISRSVVRNEWGFHGGISYEESIVPWYSVAVG